MRISKEEETKTSPEEDWFAVVQVRILVLVN